MNIANNILKHELENVYFLGGTACGGKTTMGKALAEKYGFIHFDDNYHTASFGAFSRICDPKYQTACAQVDAIRANSWEDYFQRLANGDDMLDKSGREHLQFMLMEIIKLAKDHVVIADMHLPVDVAKELSVYNRVAYLVTSPQNVLRDYYKRDDHKDIYNLIMSLKEPQASLDNLHIFLENATRKALDEICQSGVFYIMRDENSTVEKTLLQLEKHFQLT